MLGRDGPKSFAWDRVGLEKTEEWVAKSNWRVRSPRLKSFAGLPGKGQPLCGPQSSPTKEAQVT